MEVVGNLMSETFVDAFRRFTVRRGPCEELISDNGTTFVAANKELRKAVLSWQGILANEQLVEMGTRWRFITPASPFKGGLWEAAVKSMKFHLKRVTGQQIFSFEALNSLVVQVEGVMNSRPLCALSDDP